ncbi:6-phosphogluconate dehydrogenase (decarboxylating) [Candidatus Kaiserbacteria bacterium RIFCSPHIGHO2_02_FULL_54_11b]|uniref:6-phosphogluconate dehydrogenase (Decarboxylating) n=2 Tax=Candidatus Kaiseribacteriota TaxID=1752734 RepID=A0A1F6CMP4_9BACT|nr:MAG: 6-phosphogluconate dehydrogenase (decarboxylating) [Candidatus Kaiserbacteria bacterium RIFCSPHIGHO2_01_FULL_54_36b]OGG63959.1 MAG: 6-phosphogluconate dehydrogenase (decarboxylating) [Candidatus Kaiserbacteria bacterium RIFCSPHIGHO2_02_FULL_54_11b]
MTNARKEISIIGLGKMGAGIARRLLEKGWTVHGYDANAAAMQELAKEGLKTADSPPALIAQLPTPRLLWLMIPARGKSESDPRPVDELLFGKDNISALLEKSDVVIDGGNSYYKEGIERGKKLGGLGVSFIDVGFSGGPSGARNGGCLMVGGDTAAFRANEQLFRDLSVEGGYQFFEGAGAGHFVKMVHNGIEYGMMQSIGEGFAILKASEYKLDLARVADVYNHKSVIESRLVGWLGNAFEEYGQDLDAVSGTVGHSGEGEWTAKTAKELGVEAKVIEESFQFRVRSAESPSFIGKVVSALRGQFGGHSVGGK